MSEEVWKSYGGAYEVSSLGNFRRLSRKGVYVANHGWVIKGVRFIGIRGCNYSVVSIMAKIFMGKRPRGKLVRYKDGNKLNCAVDNLEYVTVRQYRLSTNEVARGERVHGCKLTEDDVLEIRVIQERCKRSKIRVKVADLAAKFHVSRKSIWYVLRKHTWRHLL